MRLSVPVAIACLVAAPVLARTVDSPSEQKADLVRVSAALNAIHAIQGGFVQIGPNGDVDQGTIYLDKPGRVRFEYDPPNPMLIVSDGRTITVKNRKLDTTDHYPLFGTPLHFILNNDVDLRNNNRIVDVRREDDNVIVDVKTNAAAWRANVSVVFSGPELELRQWTVVDAQGLSTTVALRDVKRVDNLPDALFKPNDIAPPVRKTQD
jgi:outer membrane lipoprotein-sorting protein